MTTTFLVLARTLHIGSAMLLVALPFFILFILRPITARSLHASDPSFITTLIRGLWVAWIIEALSGALWFWFVTAQMTDHSPFALLDPTDFNTVLWQTQFGQLWLGRSVIWFALALPLIFVSRKNAKTSVALWFAFIVSALLLVSLAWAGHAAAGIHYRVLHLVVDALHLFLGAVWPLGLIPFGFYLSYMNQRFPIFPEESEIAVLHRFSQASLGAVLILLITGFINGWLMVGSWLALFTTVYGLLLLAKIIFVGLMIGLGAYNRLRLLPRLETVPAVLHALERTVLAESLLALLVLLIVGIMGMTSPPS